MTKRSPRRIITFVLLASFVYELAAPMCAFALTGGPSQPEFSEFEPVATTSMVNEFTGDFTYNLPVVSIPGPNGSGYSLALSYHSGKSGEEDASWVGKGWTLNPGAVTRNKRGYPDDYNGSDVIYRSKVEPNWTVSVGKRLGVEAFGGEFGGVNGHVSARYNNYKGFSHTMGIGLDYKGIVDLGYSVTDGEGSWSFSVNPAKLLGEIVMNARRNGEYGPYTAEEEATRALNNKILGHAAKHAPQISATSIFGIHSLGEETRATSFPRYSGVSYNFNVAVQADALPIPVGLEGGISAGYTFQENIDPDTLHAFGYMYSGNAGSSDMMDYYVEKESAYNKRDRYLGIPFSNADNFIVTGEGVLGGFRLYNKNAGHFYPAGRKSTMETYQLGGDLHIGTDIGVGVDAGIGRHSLEVTRWEDFNSEHSYKFAKPEEGDEPYYFRFNGDLGGSVEFNTSDAASRARMPQTLSSTLWNNLLKPDAASTGISSSVHGGAKRSGRSAYIGYNTNREMLEQPQFSCYGSGGPSYYRAYAKGHVNSSEVDRSEPKVLDGIGEFSMVNENGMRYVYGLPVYSRNEKDLQYGIDGASVPDGFIAYKSVTPATAERVVGEQRDAPYASTFLLTEITTPDYIDRINDGPTPDDLGGYTRFNYTRKAGSDQKAAGASSAWYKWRNPYRGLSYSRNSLSDSKDDMGGVSMGEKEIYYLESIETKTHIARFITSARDDGFEAPQNEATASGSPTATSVGQGANKMQKLDRIELYAKDGSPTGKLLQTVHFEYDYSLCKGLPNSAMTSGGKTAGHLTLKRLYFQYEGAVNARVSPYVFGYTYNRTADYSALSSDQTSEYASVIGYADGLVDPLGTIDPENPDYSPFDIDRWGAYQYNGKERHKIFNPWVDQTPDVKFDPAAWQLKTIQLPSGGEIHVQYEQNDYMYVQDRPVMAMAGIKSQNGTYVVDGGTTKFYLNLAELGITSPAEVTALKAILKKRFQTDGEKIYFKFLYSLLDRTPSFTDCSTEYITGYVRVKTVDMNANGLFVELYDPDVDYAHPRDVAWNFVATSRAGILEGNGICDPSIRRTQKKDDDPWDRVYELLGVFNNTFFDKGNTCRKINLQYSYFRIPINKAKKGGGVRVKRLLMYDRGIESGAAALYGSEYLYQTEKGESSGVATNEPVQGREENPLVTYLEKREPQGWYSRAVSGRDKEQFEQPLGESILPGPSVGYSRVVVKSIHTGKTGTGFSVSEFHTVRDYPFDKTYTIAPGSAITGVDHTGIDTRDFPFTIYGVVTSFRVNNLFRTQGYSFVLNDMHGKPKSVAAYGGDPVVQGNTPPVSSTAYSYFQPGESVLMMNGIGDTVRQFPGKEVEVVFESRSVEDVTTDGSIEADMTIGLAVIFPIPWGTAFPSVQFGEEKMRTHVTTKVVRYPAIVKQMTVVKDGVTHITENVAFDPQTGKPALVRTSDGYDNLTLGSSGTPHKGSYYTYTIPAYRKYPAMGQIALSERAVIKSSSSTAIDKNYNGGHLLTFRFINDTYPGNMAMLSTGDLVKIVGKDPLTQREEYLGTFHVGNIARNQVQLLPTYISNSNSQAKVENVDIVIIRTGRTNQLGAVAGSITTYGKPPSVTKHTLQ